MFSIKWCSVHSTYFSDSLTTPSQFLLTFLHLILNFCHFITPLNCHRRICAFCFPAVLQTIGVTRWPEVRELYHALVLSRSNKVKQTLACSLHEVARILGDPLSGTASVLPYFTYTERGWVALFDTRSLSRSA